MERIPCWRPNSTGQPARQLVGLSTKRTVALRFLCYCYWYNLYNLFLELMRLAAASLRPNENAVEHLRHCLRPRV